MANTQYEKKVNAAPKTLSSTGKNNCTQKLTKLLIMPTKEMATPRN